MKSRFFFCTTVLLSMMVACIGPAQPPARDTATFTALPTHTRMVTFTPLHTLSDNASGLGSAAPATATVTVPSSTSTPTYTPLPPLPDFADVISFSPGSGGGPCIGADRTPNSITVYEGDQHISACLWLTGVDIDQPFIVRLSQPDNPNGEHFESPNLFFDGSNGTIRWEGYQEWHTFPSWDHHNGTLNFEFGVRTSMRLAPGRWRFSIVQKGSAFGEVWSDFQVPDRDRYTYISVVTRPKSELAPSTPYGFSHALLAPKDNGRLDVLGVDFPPNTPIYILLYRSIPGTLYDMQLVSKQAVVSDALGSIVTELSGPFDFGQTYIAIGISNPNIPVADDSIFFSIKHPFEQFELVPPAAKPSTLSSCPGAPQQRMIVNRRGYVCTQSDAVRLRQGPARSADVLVELPAGSQFTVTGGPACADNWSWWQIQTDEGHTGWIAEGGDEDDPYFLCTLP